MLMNIDCISLNVLTIKRENSTAPQVKVQGSQNAEIKAEIKILMYIRQMR